MGLPLAVCSVEKVQNGLGHPVDVGSDLTRDNAEKIIAEIGINDSDDEAQIDMLGDNEPVEEDASYEQKGTFNHSQYIFYFFDYLI